MRGEGPRVMRGEGPRPDRPPVEVRVVRPAGGARSPFEQYWLCSSWRWAAGAGIELRRAVGPRTSAYVYPPPEPIPSVLLVIPVDGWIEASAPPDATP